MTRTSAAKNPFQQVKHVNGALDGLTWTAQDLLVPVTRVGAPHSVTSSARRAQIVAATVEVIAESGYRGATFASIAERASLSSTRLISYHFAGKEDLVAAVVEHVVTSMGSEVGRRVRAESTAAGMLRAYIEGVVAFTAANRAQMRALLQILLAGALRLESVGTDVAIPRHVEDILRRGQETGEFRDFDPRVMAMAVQRAVEAVPFALESDPGLDCGAFARELVMLFELATRRGPA